MFQNVRKNMVKERLIGLGRISGSAGLSGRISGIRQEKAGSSGVRQDKPDPAQPYFIYIAHICKTAKKKAI